MNALPTAVFLDRDGTIIRDFHYLSRPEQVELLDGAAEAIARINAALVPAVVVTNQSGIGRGYFSVRDYEATEQRLNELLAERGAHIDATYYCPHTPEEKCRCRKPDTLLFEQAADDLDIDLGSALFIGDRFRDRALRNAGCSRPDTNYASARNRSRDGISARCRFTVGCTRLVFVHELTDSATVCCQDRKT